MQVLHDEYATKYLEQHLGVSPTKATQALVQSLLPLSQGCLQIRLKASANPQACYPTPQWLLLSHSVECIFHACLL